ncbi:MAG: hypothetical protein Q9162_005550 [Coniocarpon cinnabarinum]
MFNKIKCFYCNRWTQRPPTGKKQRLRQFKCQQCTAVNFLDEKGRITDPPLQDVLPTTPQPMRYAHAHNVSTRDNPSPSKVFCNACLKNQHMLYENLRELDAVSRDEDPNKWHQQQLYIQDLEQRYPQVCAECRPKARAAIKRANYFTRTWNMMISMRKTKGGEYAPVVQGRWWRDALLRFGQIGRESSVLGQAIWHLLGARMIVLDDLEPALGAEQPASIESFGARIVACTTQTVAAEGINPHCFTDTTPWMSYALVLGLLTIWWNNKLRMKYLDRRPGRITGTADYYSLQLFSLAVRALAVFTLQTPAMISYAASFLESADPRKLYRGAHIIMIAFILFTEFMSRTVLKLKNRYQVRQQRDEDILPDTPMPSKSSANPRNTSTANAQARPTQHPSWLRKDSKPFDVSALSGSPSDRASSQRAQAPHVFSQTELPAPTAPPTPPQDDEMEWSYTEPQFSTASFQARAAQEKKHNLRPRGAQQQSTFNAQKSNDLFARPAQSPTRRTNVNSANVSFSSFQHPKSQPPPQKQEDPDATSSTQRSNGGEWNRQRTDIQMTNPSFFLEKDKVDTGLEKIFGDVFTLQDATPRKSKAKAEPMARSGSAFSHESLGGDGASGREPGRNGQRGHGGMFGAAYGEGAQNEGGGVDVGVYVLLVFAVVVVGMAIAAKTGSIDIGGFLRGMKTESTLG